MRKPSDNDRLSTDITHTQALDNEKKTKENVEHWRGRKPEIKFFVEFLLVFPEAKNARNQRQIGQIIFPYYQ